MTSRSRQELSSAYLVAKIGVDTDENELSKAATAAAADAVFIENGKPKTIEKVTEIGAPPPGSTV